MRMRHAGEVAPKALLLAVFVSQGPLPGVSSAVCAVRCTVSSVVGAPVHLVVVEFYLSVNGGLLPWADPPLSGGCAWSPLGGIQYYLGLQRPTEQPRQIGSAQALTAVQVRAHNITCIGIEHVGARGVEGSATGFCIRKRRITKNCRAAASTSKPGELQWRRREDCTS